MNKSKTILKAAVICFAVLFAFGSLTASAGKKGRKGKVGNAILETTMGDIEIAFFPDVAPGHVDNFKKLAGEGFYDGTIFHRVIPGFMIQGGDPNSKSENRETHGAGGPGYDIKAEFNDTKHVRGIVSMARSQDPDSAGSQFFIVLKDSPFLDGQYTVFGRVVDGMDVADKIVNSERDSRDNPLDRIVIETVTVTAKE